MAEEIKDKREPILYVEDVQSPAGASRVDGRLVKRKSVTDDKLQNVSSIADNTITTAMFQSAVVTKAKVNYEEITVNVAPGATTGTGTATNGSVIIGWRPAGNVDQVIDSIAISGTTITVTLGVAATAQNNFVVICLKA